jgi:hypothetical protein
MSVVLSNIRLIKYFKYNGHVVEDNKVDPERQQYKSPRKTNIINNLSPTLANDHFFHLKIPINLLQ